MVAYFIVECPCRRGDKHSHKVTNPDVIGLVTENSFEKDITEKIQETNEENVKIFYYTCDKSKHKCKVWINTENGKQRMSKCNGCHR